MRIGTTPDSEELNAYEFIGEKESCIAIYKAQCVAAWNLTNEMAQESTEPFFLFGPHPPPPIENGIIIAPCRR